PRATRPSSDGTPAKSPERGKDPRAPKTRPAASMLREPIVVTAGGWWTNANAGPDHYRRKGSTKPLSGPWKLGLAAAAVLILGLVIGIWASAAHQAVLIVDGQNGFEDARLVILVDGDAVFSRTLSADRKEASFMGRRLFDYGSQEFGGKIRLAPGEHEIVAEVLPAGEDEPYRDATTVDLESGDRRRLRIRTGKAMGRPLAIHLD
ncbi:MAG TPA: hypothetical protein VNI57_00030, partial [Candidatus Saccharimonadales bacterium]|nr:hypothetical protein [Candidatus Saccharimonadales bacterium]